MAISVAPPANMFDFSFLAPCPSSGLIIQGTEDDLVPEPEVAKLVERLRIQRGITIDYQKVPGAGHFFDTELDELVRQVGSYLDRSNAGAEAAAG